jgi:hypothetical protein
MNELLPPRGAKQWILPRDVYLFASHGTIDTITSIDIGRDNTRLFPEYLRRDGSESGDGRLFEWHEYEHDDHEVSSHCQTDVKEFFKRHT